jgi:hypothetical protein
LRRPVGTLAETSALRSLDEKPQNVNDMEIIRGKQEKPVAQEVLPMSNPTPGVVEQGIDIMLSRCANSRCCKPFLRLREGKLFLVETERVARPGESTSPPFVRARRHQRLVEHYWLCDDCATQWTLMYSRESGIAISPLGDEIAASPAERSSRSGSGLRFG